MIKHKLSLRIMFAIAISLLVIDAAGSTAMACSCTRRSATIAFSLGHGKCAGHMHARSIIVTKPHRKVFITSPLIEGFIRIGPPLPKIVVVEKPRVRHIVVNLSLTKRISKPRYKFEQRTITVWITNSNGSKTSVTLTNSGPGFLGPRGEWYTNMPTEEQLRMIYGF